MEIFFSISFLLLSLALGISLSFNVFYNYLIKIKKEEMKKMEHSYYRMKTEIVQLNSELSIMNNKLDKQK